MDMFAPKTPAWLDELKKVEDVCFEARAAITELNPNAWWQQSNRGDWMLYYLYVSFISMEQLNGVGSPSAMDVAANKTDGIAKHVRCGRDGFGTYDWNTSFPSSKEKLSQLADRIRRIWPDIPLAI